jgi:hypothetical protein
MTKDSDSRAGVAPLTLEFGLIGLKVNQSTRGGTSAAVAPR